MTPVIKRLAITVACVCTAAALFGAFPNTNRAALGVPGERLARADTNGRDTADIPPEIANLMHRAGELINHHSVEEFANISMPDAHLGWVSGAASKWSVDALYVPDDSVDKPTYLAVFHTWHTCESDGDHVHRIQNTAAGWKIGEEILETDTTGFRIRDHDLTVSTDIPQKRADITDRVKFDRTGTGSYGIFRISEDYTVDQITPVGASAGAPPIRFRQAGGVVAFIPPPGKSFELAMHYTGTVDHADGDFLHHDEITLSSYWYPVIARLPATATVTTTANRGWTALAQGELVSSDPGADGARRVTYRNNLPVSYFTLDLGRYTVTSRRAGSRTLSVYLLDASSSLAKQCLDTTEKALAFYELHFGAFPYTRYGIVQSHGVSQMALEAYSFATFGPHTLPDLIPHELSHTFWGGRLPCAYTHSMWNEAFADYSDDLFQRRVAPQAHRTAAEVAADRLKTAHAYDVMPLGEASDTNNGAQTAIGYDKGHKVLRMLEFEIGQEAMYKAMAAFLNNHTAGEAAEWPEFEAAVDRVTKGDYKWFFDEWLEQPGLPNIRLENVSIASGRSGKVILADVIQAGVPYRLSMECKVATRRHAAALSRVKIDGPRTHLEIPVDSDPISITIDPDGIAPLAPPPGADADAAYSTYSFAK